MQLQLLAALGIGVMAVAAITLWRQRWWLIRAEFTRLRRAAGLQRTIEGERLLKRRRLDEGEVFLFTGNDVDGAMEARVMGFGGGSEGVGHGGGGEK